MAYRAKQKHVGLDGTTQQIYYETDDQSIKVSSDNTALPTGVSTLKDIEDNLGTLAFEDEVEIPDASTTQVGVTMLSNATTGSAENVAATTKAVSDVNSGAVHNTGNETVGGTKTFSSGQINLGGLQLIYDETTGELTITVPSTNPT